MNFTVDKSIFAEIELSVALRCRSPYQSFLLFSFFLQCLKMVLSLQQVFVVQVRIRSECVVWVYECVALSVEGMDNASISCLIPHCVYFYLLKSLSAFALWLVRHQVRSRLVEYDQWVLVTFEWQLYLWRRMSLMTKVLFALLRRRLGGCRRNEDPRRLSLT